MDAKTGYAAQKVCLHKVGAESGVVFGTSGVRGLVSDMRDDVCYAYTTAFLQTVATGAEAIVIGHDLRPSSPRITAACAAAVRDAGRRLIYVGSLPNPAIAYYATEIGAPCIVITGSHIPFDRNGIKFYSKYGEISKAEEQQIVAAEVQIPAEIQSALLPKANEIAVSKYIDRYVDFFGTDVLKDTKVAIYEHSSVARDLLRTVLEELGAVVISLGRADTFVPIDTEAVRWEDIEQAKTWAAEYGFDAIISTDGDADRPLIGDESGTWMRGDIVGILCSSFLGAESVVTPVSCNTALEKSDKFKSVVRTRIGSPYVIEGIESVLKHNAVAVGYEANGGFLLGSEVFRQNKRLKPLMTRDAFLPIISLLVLARQSHLPLSKLPASLPPRYTFSDRIQNIPTQSSIDLINQLQGDQLLASRVMGSFRVGSVTNVDLTDGLRVTFFSGAIVHLRPSGNAPELRCYAEADTEMFAKQLCNECLQQVVSVISDIPI